MPLTVRAAVLLLAASPLTLAAAVSNVLVNNPGADATSADTQVQSVVVRLDATTLFATFFDSAAWAASRYAGIARSTNNGAAWTDLGALPASSVGDAGYQHAVRHQQTGGVYVSAASSSVVNAIPVFRSTDGGVTFAAPVNAAPGATIVDYPSIASDNDAASPFYGRLYAAYRESGGSQGMRISRSTDAGVTWAPSGGVAVSSSTSGYGASLAMMTSGNLGVSFFSQGTPSTIQFTKSTDGGITFSTPSPVTTLVTTGFQGDLGLGFEGNAFPRAAVNRANGTLYVAYNDAAAASGGDRGNVFFRASTDLGATWSSAVKVNTDGTTRAQFIPSIGVPPDGSKILVAWYDRRSDPADAAVEYYGALGTPASGSATFGTNFRISSASFQPVIDADPNYPTGWFTFYEEMSADNTGFDVAWSDGRDAATFSGASRKNMNVRYSRIPTALLRGDVNGDFSVDVADVFYLINNLFAGGPAPASACQADANHDSAKSVNDVFYLINYLFAGGPAPAPPC
jgi:hypothetical protein